MTPPTDPPEFAEAAPLAPDEIATAEQAATDAEQRYQARERGLRAAARETDAAVEHAEAERLNPPKLYRAGDGPPVKVDGVLYAPENKPTRLERKIEAFAQEIHAAGDRMVSAPIRQPLTIAGTFRIYFNRHQAAPLVWSIALDGEGLVDGRPWHVFEIAVAEVVITAAAGARTVYLPKATPDHEDGKPSAWLEVDGVLRIDPSSSTARIG